MKLSKLKQQAMVTLRAVNAEQDEVILMTIHQDSLAHSQFRAVDDVMRAFEDGDQVTFVLELNGKKICLGTVRSNVVSAPDRDEEDTRAQVINPEGRSSMVFMGEVVRTGDIGFQQARTYINYMVNSLGKAADFSGV